MKTRVIKEARALLPAFALTVGLTLAASLFWRGSTALDAGIIVFATCCTLLGANCFGHEFSSQTIGLLLAQPVSRRRIWHEKMLVLGIAILLAFAAWFACALWLTDHTTSNDATFWPVLTMTVIPAVIFCSAPWMALNTRNTMLAGLGVWMVPFGLVMCLVLASHYLVQDKFDDFVNQHPVRCVLAGGGIYCALAYWSGYQALKHFQSATARPREIALPDRWQDALARPLGKLLPRYASPMTSLLRKEILLQRPAYVAAAALGLLALLAAISNKIHDTDGSRGLFIAPLAICVVILPLVVTGLSVAEERTLGMAAWHRTLPPSLRQQWLVKLAVVLVTCVMLGVILPWFMRVAGQALGLFPDTPARPIQWLPASIPLTGCLAYLVVLAIGIFASSVSTTTFRAIMLTLVLLCVIGTLIPLSNGLVGLNFTDHPWRSRPPNGDWHLPEIEVFLIVNSALAVFLALLSVLAYINYRTAEPSPGRAWAHSGIILGAAATLAIVMWTLYFIFIG